MIRVLHVTECYAAGVRHAIRTIAALTPDYEHHLLWTGDETPDEDVGFASRTKLPGSNLQRARQVRALAKELKADVIHAHSSWAGFFVRLLPQSVPVVYEPHAYIMLKPTLAPWKRMIFHAAEKLLALNTDATVVLSDAEEKIASGLSRRMSLWRLPNVASVRPQFRLERPFLDQTGAPRIVTIGRVCSQKDPEFFRAVVRRVRKCRPDAEFVWIGDGEAEEVESLRYEGVRVTGWLDSEGLEKELIEASIYLHTASYEGFPLSVLDAAAFSIPIVVRAIPAFERVDLLDSADETGCALHIVQLLCDQGKWRNAVEKSERLDSDMHPVRQAEVLSKIYRSLNSGEAAPSSSDFSVSRSS